MKIFKLERVKKYVSYSSALFNLKGRKKQCKQFCKQTISWMFGRGNLWANYVQIQNQHTYSHRNQRVVLFCSETVGSPLNISATI